MHDGDSQLHRGVVQHVAHREVVGAVHDHVVAVDDLEDVVGPQADVVGDHVDVGVESRERLLGRVDFALAHPVDVVQDLALQVRGVDHVHVHDAERAHAGGSQVQRRGRAQATGAEAQDAGIQQAHLALLADLRQQQVPVVAVALLGAEHLRYGPGPALVLPLVEAAVHGGRLRIAQRLQRLGGEGRAHTPGTEHHDRCVAARKAVLDVGLQVAARDVDRTGDGALGDLVGFTHVQKRCTGVAQALTGRRVDLGDPRLGVDEQIAECGHRFGSLAVRLGLPAGGALPRP